MPKVNPKKLPQLNTYGLNIPGATQLTYDMLAFSARLPLERTGITRPNLYHRISDILTPTFHEWHQWTDMQVDAMCHHRFVGLLGCSNSAKTRNAMGFAVNWWLCDPARSSVTIVSTSKDAVRRKAWAEVQHAYELMPWPKFGNMVDSRMRWQCTKGDEKHCIIGRAVEEGAVTKVADDIKGHHTERQMLIIDEATAVHPAIWEATSNLWSYPAGQRFGEFVMVVIFNPRNTRLDDASRFCEPKDGWTSISQETDTWETVPHEDNRTGIAVHFNALKSPNIIAGYTVSRHLPSKDMVNAAINRFGSSTSPSFWSNMIGFWPPQGVELTVFNEAQLRSKNCYDNWKFLDESFIVAGFDPVFTAGGDRPTLQPIRVGLTPNGLGLQILPSVVISLDNASSKEIAFQLAHGLQRACENYQVNGQPMPIAPDNVAIDETGGHTICDVIYREWSHNVIRVNSSASPSDRPVSLEDPRPGKMVYNKKGTELWFQARNYVDAGMVRGMTHELAKELIERHYENDSEGGSVKCRLESKVVMKVRIKCSPDLADAFMLAIEAARRRGIQVQPMGITQKIIDVASQETKEAEAVLTTNLFQPGNEDEYDVDPSDLVLA